METPSEKTADADDVRRAIAQLSYRRRNIFELRTGFKDGFRYTNREIGYIFKISPTRVSQLYRDALRRVIDELGSFRPESVVDQLLVRDVLTQAKQLTPFLITYLKANPDDLVLLHWRVFEQLVAEFYASWGYDEVRLVGRNPNTAADVFALRKIQPDGTEVRVFIETKRWKDRVDVQVVDRVMGAFLAEKSTFGWHMAMIVTLTGFTKMKKYTPERLKMNGIELKKGDDVMNWLRDYRFSKGGLWLPSTK